MCCHLLTCSSLHTPSPRAFLSFCNVRTNYLHQNKVFPKTALSLGSFLKAAFSWSPGFPHNFTGQCAWPWPAVWTWRVWTCTSALVASPQLDERLPNLPECPCALLLCACMHVCVAYACTPMLRAQGELYPLSNTTLLSSGTLHPSCISNLIPVEVPHFQFSGPLPP